MNTNLTDTQKFRIANEIAKPCTGQHPAYGSHHWEPVKQEERKTECYGSSCLVWVLVRLSRFYCGLQRLFEKR